MNGLDQTSTGSMYFALSTAVLFVIVGLVLSWRKGRPHPLLLVCISAASFSWIEGRIRSFARNEDAKNALSQCSTQRRRFCFPSLPINTWSSVGTIISSERIELIIETASAKSDAHE